MIDGYDGCLLFIFRCNHVKGTIALQTEEQAAGLGHFGGVIFDDVFGFQRGADFANGDAAFEHSLHRMGAK